MPDRSHEIEAAAYMTLPRLAQAYHAEICRVYAEEVISEREPQHMKAEMLFQVGRYRFGKEWMDALHQFEWPRPIRPTRAADVGKTSNPWDAAA